MKKSTYRRAMAVTWSLVALAGISIDACAGGFITVAVQSPKITIPRCAETGANPTDTPTIGRVLAINPRRDRVVLAHGLSTQGVFLRQSTAVVQYPRQLVDLTPGAWACFRLTPSTAPGTPPILKVIFPAGIVDIPENSATRLEQEYARLLRSQRQKRFVEP